MAKRDDPIGEIPCPLCGRAADVLKFNERTKLDPEGGEGRAAYPRKIYIVCPPVRGYAGCGTIMAAGAEGQARILDKAKMFGAEGKPAAAAASPAPAPAAPKAAPAPSNPPPAPAKPADDSFKWPRW